MDKIETTQILKNLNTALAHAKDRFTHEFIMQEVILNDTFKFLSVITCSPRIVMLNISTKQPLLKTLQDNIST